MESRCAADCIHSSSAESNPNRSTQYDRSMDVTKLLEQIRSFCDNIPSPNDYSYFRSFPEFSSLANDVTYKALTLIQRMIHCYFPTFSEDLTEIDRLSSEEDFQIISTFTSAIYLCIKELLKDDAIEFDDDSNRMFFQTIGEDQFEFLPYLVSSTIEKPQKVFKMTVSTDSQNFAPILKEKHNAKKEYIPTSCNIVPNMFLMEDYARQIGVDIQNSEIRGYINPYSYEINHIEYPAFEDKDPVVIMEPKEITSFPCKVIDSDNDFISLIQTLLNEDAIAFDIREHHFRSYLGFTCVLIISTHSIDYVIDAVRLHDLMWKLNEVFTNEHIMKVFSGRETIITSLQRDFGIYCVNVFSLIQAARVLSLSSVCVKKLIQKYCGVSIHPLPSTCDWRVRPLDDIFIQDARSVSHYLLYIADRMRVELLQASPPNLNLIHDVLARGNEAALCCYEKPAFSYQNGCHYIPQLGLVLTSKQKELFLSLTYWRDIVARIKDESPQYILPLDCIIRIVYASSAKQIPMILRHYDTHLQEYEYEVEKVYYTISVITDAEMSDFAVGVEGLCRNYLKCPIDTCKNCLSDSCTVENVSLGRAQEEYPNENEPFPCTTLQASLQRLINHGTFKHIYPRDNKEKGFLYYSPNSLPYNVTAPLRNTVPYIPIEITDEGVWVSSIIPKEYVNEDIRRYVDKVNASRTKEDVDEMEFIKEGLGLDSISRNLMMLGSVLDDDAISLSSEEEEEEDTTKPVDKDTYVPHYPPRTLKEIYSLPHKNRGDLKDGLIVSKEEIAKVANVIQSNELPEEELDVLLQEGNTENKSDMEFLKEIGWTTKADELERVFKVSGENEKSEGKRKEREREGNNDNGKYSHKVVYSHQKANVQGEYWNARGNRQGGRKFGGKNQKSSYGRD